MEKWRDRRQWSNWREIEKQASKQGLICVNLWRDSCCYFDVAQIGRVPQNAWYGAKPTVFNSAGSPPRSHVTPLLTRNELHRHRKVIRGTSLHNTYPLSSWVLHRASPRLLPKVFFGREPRSTVLSIFLFPEGLAEVVLFSLSLSLSFPFVFLESEERFKEIGPTDIFFIERALRSSNEPIRLKVSPYIVFEIYWSHCWGLQYFDAVEFGIC